jgi:hypothetical protein
MTSSGASMAALHSGQLTLLMIVSSFERPHQAGLSKGRSGFINKCYQFLMIP